ncbi:MAG: sulfurtransferase TusA family protein [Gammaproteobacteria bacterium]|nr:sulfurtransferase TusA family protein [Gammaproteobacteria bacterium]
MAEQSQTVEVDARRLLCPMPVIRLQDAISELTIGDMVKITCTDPGVKSDIPAWCNINKHSLLNIEDQQYEIIITVRKENDD